MLNIAHRVLHFLGATEVYDVSNNLDPTTEQEFLLINFKSPNPISWEMYKNTLPTIRQKIGNTLLRIERNRLLSGSDWIMTVDNFQSLANKDEWIAYRKALRDLPLNPPEFKWKDDKLDFSKMSMPVEPPITRLP